MNNIDLFNYSLNNPEPIIDNFYLKNQKLIISENPLIPTSLMIQNLNLIENITTYCFAQKNNDTRLMEKVIDSTISIIKSKNINYSEFVSFWSVVDISYSIFNKMILSDQKEILKKIIEKYINLRHNIYGLYGYSPTTLQVGKDAKAHKESGSLGVNKVAKLLDNLGFQMTNNDSVKNFVDLGEKKYLESDKKGKKLFRDLLNYYKITFSWSSNKEGKLPDLLIRYRNDIFIVEHKHMKESGGGQDKQINEIISFISNSESNTHIHYVSFLDGIYFNLFTNIRYINKSNKISNQLVNIENNLKINYLNYFVNTAGFVKLIKEFK